MESTANEGNRLLVSVTDGLHLCDENVTRGFYLKNGLETKAFFWKRQEHVSDPENSPPLASCCKSGYGCYCETRPYEESRRY
jgi:hypothetical protein